MVILTSALSEPRRAHRFLLTLPNLASVDEAFRFEQYLAKGITKPSYTVSETEHKFLGKILQVTVEFVGEVITCIRDKDKNIVSGDPEKIKKIYDTWVFSRDTSTNNPNWQLVDTLS